VQKALKTDFPHLSPTEKDDHTILVSVPPVSKERKLELLKDMKQMVEKSRQAVRNIRASARADLKKGSFTSDQRFKAEKLIQHLVDESLKNIDGLHNDKQKSFEK
jgi:ribosome recycling factor